MKYKVKFPNHSIERKFDKALSKISQRNIQDKIIEAVEKLADNPYPYGEKLFKKIKPPPLMFAGREWLISNLLPRSVISGFSKALLLTGRDT